MKQIAKNRYVYFMLADGSPDGRIKIGCSYKPAQRLFSGGFWSCYPLKLLAVVPGDFDTERALHAFFADNRLHNEWFRSSPALLSVMRAMSRGATFDEATAPYRLARAA